MAHNIPTYLLASGLVALGIAVGFLVYLGLATVSPAQRAEPLATVTG